MDPIHKLAALFGEFPGIGSRQSKRFVYFLLKKNRSYTRELAALIEQLQESVRECVRCHRYFTKKHNEAVLCVVCANTNRDHTLLMVVEKDSDLEAVERSGTYHGTYFILGGTLQILEKNPESKIRINDLLNLAHKEKSELKEIILACALTPESEHTREYVHHALTPLQENFGINITTLGRGLSTGTELEYSDAETLRYALEGRK